MKYSIKVDDQIFEVEITDLRSRPIVALVDGEPIEVWVESSAEKAAQHSNHVPVIRNPPAVPIGAGVPTAGSIDLSVIRAPIPGTIVAVAAKPGDQVAVGQELCVLEAMKMRNSIRSGRDGEIATVHVTPGDTVLHNDLLIEFAD